MDRNKKGQFIKGHLDLVSIEARKRAGKKLKGRKLSEEHKKKLKEWGNQRKGTKRPPFSEKWKENIRKARLGKKPTEETRKKLSEALRGERGSNWKGGITPENKRIRESIEVRLWREAVFARDNWTCQKCKIRGGVLHSHHIQNFAQVPELRTSIGNGITLCDKCHREFHRKYGRKNNTRSQLVEYPMAIIG